jgi:hypothetical protein
MAGRLSSRAKWTGALIALGVVFAWPAYTAFACNLTDCTRVADTAPPAEKGKSTD